MAENLAGFVRDIRRRNIRESVAAVVVMAFFGLGLLLSPSEPLDTAGRIVLVAACLLILAVSWGRLHIPESELATRPPAQHSDHWRGLMSRQACWLRYAWLWYVLPLFAGMVMVLFGRVGQFPAVTIGVVIVIALLAAGIAFANIVAARQIERDRDAWLAR